MIVGFSRVDDFLEELGHHQLHEHLVRVERVYQGSDICVEASAVTMEGDILRLQACCGAFHHAQAETMANETMGRIRIRCGEKGLSTRGGVFRDPKERPA